MGSERQRPSYKYSQINDCVLRSLPYAGILMTGKMRQSLHVQLFCALACAAMTLAVPVKVRSSWTGGFDGEFSIPITTATSGWTLRLTFSGPVNALEIWDADVQQTLNGGKEFILVNKPTNRDLKAGTTLSMNFVARVSGANPTATVVLVPKSAGNPPATTKPAAAASSGTYNYNEVLTKSILFYEAQRSGKLPASNRVPWRGDSALGDKGDKGEDLTGGWYDAGDHVKFGFPMAFSVTVLAWGLLEYPDAYRSAGQYNIMLDSIKWPLDYFIKAHVSKYELYGQVGNGDADHGFWGRPEDMKMARPAYKITANKPGSELAAETAAAMAAGYMAFKTANPGYAKTLLQHAKDLYEFAEKYQGDYSVSIPDAAKFYKSWSGYKDELAWGAAWLYWATNDAQYLNFAKKYYHPYNGGPFSWDNKFSGTQVLLHRITKQAEYGTHAKNFLDTWLPGNGKFYTPKGLAYDGDWGPLRGTANTAFLALVAADHGLNVAAYRKFAKSQLHYMLGDSGRSFVIGFGKNPPHSPHHRASSCPLRPAPCTSKEANSPNPNPQILYGALVGGPDKSDNFKNDRGDWKLNEVACDYNAAFQSAIAGLKHLELTNKL